MMIYLHFFVIVLLIIIIYKKNLKSNFEMDTEYNLNYFDKIMYINLEHRKDRKIQIENEFKKMGVSDDKIIRIDAVREKLNGHIGCCKSHIKALEYAKELGLNNVVIFEDDFVFTKDKKHVDSMLTYFLKKFKEWDVIMLTSVHKSLEDIDDIYIKKVNSASTSSAYIIQKHFYDKLLYNLKSALSKMENEMVEFKKNNPNKKKHETSHALDQHWNSLQKESKWYIFYPYLGEQGGSAGGSSIMGAIESFFNYMKESFVESFKV